VGKQTKCPKGKRVEKVKNFCLGIPFESQKGSNRKKSHCRVKTVMCHWEERGGGGQNFPKSGTSSVGF
jgi:hypothetical protein